MRASRPNVLMICGDDLNAWIGPLGRHPGVRTPQIDALAERGVVFTHAYCTAPHCNPSRTSVFTGLRPTTTGVYVGEVLTAHDCITLPEHFRACGYTTFGAGKVFHGQYDYRTATRRYATMATWLDSHNRLDVWDEFHPCADEPLPSGRPFNGFYDFERDEVPDWYCHFDWGPIPDELGERLPDVRVAEQAIEFLRRPHERPFFAAVGFYRPHLPWYVPKRYFDMHPLEDVVLPDVRSDELDGVPPIARDWALTPPDHERVVASGHWRRAVQGYLASMSFCDEMIGRVIAALDATGRAEDTIVVVWGDNGFHLGEKLHWRKFTLWEEATRVPLLVRAPGARPGHRCTVPVSLLDLFPTLVELTGVGEAPGLEGESFAACLTGVEAERRSLPISTWGRGNHSVRSQRWRLTRYRDGTQELYDHDTDPRERRNLAGRTEHAATIAALAPHLDRLQED